MAVRFDVANWSKLKNTRENPGYSNSMAETERQENLAARIDSFFHERLLFLLSLTVFESLTPNNAEGVMFAYIWKKKNDQNVARRFNALHYFYKNVKLDFWYIQKTCSASNLRKISRKFAHFDANWGNFVKRSFKRIVKNWLFFQKIEYY